MNFAQDTFISSTFWSEKLGPVAAIKTIQKCVENDVYSHIIKIGEQIQDLWKFYSDEYDLPINVTGIPPLSLFSFTGDNALEKHTLFTQEMLNYGFLASNSFYVLWKHNEDIINKYSLALERVFEKISLANKANNINDLLRGPVKHGTFKRLT